MLYYVYRVRHKKQTPPPPSEISTTSSNLKIQKKYPADPQRRTPDMYPPNLAEKYL